jgi:outer membrane protein assembly factor BamE (lipoprotein component of BamABCDE complex)
MKKILLLAAVTAAVAAASSCSKYDDVLESSAVRRNSDVMPPKSVSENMPSDKLQVPSDARDVSWDREGQYWELSYETGYGVNKVEVEVYFDADGNWVMTKTDVRMKDVPSYIKDYVTSSAEYAGVKFSDRDAEYIERPAGNSYLLEVILDRNEIDLEITEDGLITQVR